MKRGGRGRSKVAARREGMAGWAQTGKCGISGLVPSPGGSWPGGHLRGWRPPTRITAPRAAQAGNAPTSHLPEPYWEASCCPAEACLRLGRVLLLLLLVSRVCLLGTLVLKRVAGLLPAQPCSSGTGSPPPSCPLKGACFRRLDTTHPLQIKNREPIIGLNN